MLVNGKVWPFLEVEPRMYRFRILNGCNARILSLDIGGPSLWQIGAEGGMWDVPVPVKHLVLAPAERADVLLDFTKFAGQTLVMKNHKPPRPVSNPAPSLESVMQIRVGTTVSHPGPRAIPSSLPGRKADLTDPVTTRYITLNEIDTDEPTWFLNLNGVHFDEGPTTETPKVGTVEDWVYINMTGDTHPMHTHLVTFQVVGRTPFDVEAYEEANEGPHGVPGGIDPTPYATGPMVPAPPDERGFKDTVKANPGQFTTIRAKFELPTDVTPRGSLGTDVLGPAEILRPHHAEIPSGQPFHVASPQSGVAVPHHLHAPGDVALQREDEAHRLVSQIGGWGEHAWPAPIDHADPLLSAVFRSCLGNAAVPGDQCQGENTGPLTASCRGRDPRGAPMVPSR